MLNTRVKASPKSPEKMRVRRDTLTAYAFLAPFLLTLLVFFFYGFVRAVYFSFTDYDLFNPPKFVGLKSYINIFQDDKFRIALTNTLLFSFVTTTLQTAGALLLAVVLNQRIRGLMFFRSAYYMPSITSSVVITLVFLWLFQKKGIANYLTTQFTQYTPHIVLFVVVLVVAQIIQVIFERLREAKNYVPEHREATSFDALARIRRVTYVHWSDPLLLWISAAIGGIAVLVASFMGWIQPRDVATFDFDWVYNTDKLFGLLPIPLLFIILMNTFTTIPTLMLFFLAGLQGIPTSLYEAAELDGATPGQKFWYVTVPQLQPVTFYAVTISLIGTLQMFDQVKVIGDAAPLDSIITLSYYIYNYSFRGGSSLAGMASAAAMILAVLTLLVVLVQRQFFKDEVNR
ncbi:carbohydrate ABC transporter permease [Deinococcus cellulosilyticus]|uniref:ABC transporter permease n=1 Tax=Deinococcus cellulosilyticus (strain DSM 18568 / NBRC 106333 / KACC 11606 / 5516J-15) TaxID=1223518 RepID=A0A511N4J4_DEIC1|nr:sugar ABC transporter permease [Deinococcus cellulosilyticus]GEM47783.1 ABC transporter permease [Deinococcus cellulosilyticus NBRC 106333 = KACC 11606]